MAAVVFTVSCLLGQLGQYELRADPNAVRSETIGSLIIQLGADPKRGKAAALTLVKHGRAAVPALIGALKADNDQVRFYAASCLDVIGGPAAARALFRLLLDEKAPSYLRLIAARAMGSCGHAQAAAYLARLAVGAGLGPDPEKEKLAGSPLPGEEGESFRYEVVRALARIGSSLSDDILVAALERDESARIRAAAAVAVGDRRIAEGLEALGKALSDPAPEVARGAAYSLGMFGKAAASAAPELVEALSRPEPEVRRVVRGTLRLATGRSFKKRGEWVEWLEERSRKEKNAPAPEVDPVEELHELLPFLRETRKGRGTSGDIPPALAPPWEWDSEP